MVEPQREAPAESRQGSEKCSVLLHRKACSGVAGEQAKTMEPWAGQSLLSRPPKYGFIQRAKSPLPGVLRSEFAFSRRCRVGTD